MPTFSYEAVDRNGQAVKNRLEAGNRDDALRRLRSQGLKPTKITEVKGAAKPSAEGEKKKKKGLALFNRVSRVQLTQFTTQLATLQDAGLPIVRSLHILENQLKPGKFRDIIGEVAADVEGGSTFSEALNKHPKVFDILYVSMVRAGEAGGVLDKILNRLAFFQEKTMRLRKKVQGAMYYPIAVVTIAVVILAFILTYVVPQFEKMFKEQTGGGLPAITQLLVSMSQTVKSYWFLLPGVPFCFYVLVKAIARSDKGRLGIDKFKLKMPLFGNIIKKSTVSRFCRTLGTLITSGVPILEALRIVKDAVGNKVISNAVESVHGSIREGETIAEPLRQSGVFDDLIVSMISVGEETGEIDKMLSKIADNYDLEVDVAVESFSRLLEPLIIVFLGGMVAFIVISLFMPLINIIKSIGEGGG
jgi:type IV pilus assembly protein PilC